MISGEHVGTLAMSETIAGSDAASPNLVAEKKSDRYILNGNRVWVTNGPVADIFIVYAKIATEKKNHKLISFIVEK